MKLWVSNFVARYYSYQTVEAIKECFESLFRAGVIDRNEEVFCTVTSDERSQESIGNRAVLNKTDCFGQPYIKIRKNLYIASVQPYMRNMRNGARYPSRNICAAIVSNGGSHVCYVQASVFKDDGDASHRKWMPKYNSLLLDTEANSTIRKNI